ncbi:MAG: curli-like amyloid fiber formation chaperone CsgH [Allosphingosinicella sp.]
MLSQILAAALALTAADTPSAEPPVRLVTEEAGQGIRLRVVGESAVPFAGNYALEVTSDAAAGGNRTVQRGAVRLEPGVPATLMTLTLGHSGQGSWTARLRVEPSQGAAYEEVRRAR